VIEYVKGRLEVVDGDGLVVEAAGIGLRVRVHDPERFRNLLGTPVSVPVLLDIQARSVRLIGFKTVEERSQFETLLKIPGVGAGTALKLLPVYAALMAPNAQMPIVAGIGPAMRTKIARWLARHGGTPATASIEAELRAVLEGLGLSPAEAKARAARVAAKAAGADLEALVRLAVKH
jgi:Holliday junction resolvasome RuvABC DNA-binding subunit